MSNNVQADLTKKVEKKLKELRFKSPQNAENPKFIEKKIKEVFTEKPKKEKKVKQKKSNFSREEIIKKVAALIN
jgi:signal recognition particle subunit SEC65